MDTKSEIRQFLTSRRAKVTPDQAGLRVYGDKRRVPGLRRLDDAERSQLFDLARASQASLGPGPRRR
jgi:hypothetical protein